VAGRRGATTEHAGALRRCAADTRAGLARRAFQRSGELESCLVARLEAGTRSTPAVSQWSTRDLNVSFRFSSSGRIRNWGCVAVVEPSDPHTWADNFLCYRQETE